MNRVTKLPPNLRAHLYPDACDMRRSFDGLHALVRERLRLDPLSGDRFLFANRRKNRVKVLYWDGSGLVVLAKRFEHGVFAIPSRVELTMDEMEAILNGLDLQQAERPRRYRHHAAGANLRSPDPPAA